MTTIRLPRLEPAHVRVVDEDGAGVKSLAVVCCAQRMVSSASDTGDHEFVLAPGQAYSVLVQAMDIQHALLREDVHEWIPPKTDHRLTVTLRPDADRHEAAKRVDARGRVVDRHGEPLGGVLVTPLESVEREGLFGFPYKEFSDDDDVEPPLRDATATDAKGRFRLGTAYEGGYLRFEKPGYGPIAVAVASARDRDTVLPAAARLRIRVNMPGAWNANHWRFDLARDGSRAWTTLVPVPRGRSRFEFAPLGEGSYRAYPLIDAAAEAELRDVGPGRITVRLRTIGFVLERDVDVAEGGTTDVDFTLPDR